jgi:hypothetical protein
MSQRAFVPPPALFVDDGGDDDWKKNRAKPPSSTSSPTVPSPPALPPTPIDPVTGKPMSKAEARLAHCRRIVQKHPVEMYDCRAVAREGIPDQLRGVYWRILLGYLPLRSERWPSVIEESHKNYQELLKTLLNVNERGEIDVEKRKRAIDVDIPRTMPALHFFAKEDIKIQEGIPVTFSPNQQSLRRILHLFAACNPGLGYVQGMNEIAGHMLYTFATSHDESILPFTPTQIELVAANTEASLAESGSPLAPSTSMGSTPGDGRDLSGSVNGSCSIRNAAGCSSVSAAVEADVFFCVQTMNSYLGDTFCRALDTTATGVTGVMRTFNVLLYCCDPEMYRFLEKLNCPPELYAFRWITVAFTQEFLLPEVLRVWDFLLSFGNDIKAALFFTAITMLILAREQLFKCNFPQAMQLLQNYPPPDDIQQLLNLAEQLIATQGLDLVAKIVAGEVSIPGGVDQSGVSGGDSGAGSATPQKGTAIVVEQKIKNFVNYFLPSSQRK